MMTIFYKMITLLLKMTNTSSLLPSRWAGTLSFSSSHVRSLTRDVGCRNDVKRVMRDSLTAVPFCLRGDERGGGEGCGGAAGVAVHEPLEAHFLASDLRITHDEFTPAPLGGAFVRGIDRLFGEVSRGLQHTERMLETGAHLTGFGRLTLAGNGRVSLSPPLGDGGYVLTTQTRDDVVRVVRSEARAIAVVAAVAAAVGAAVAAYWWRRQRSEREKLDAVLERVRSRRDSGASAIEGDPCVVCLGRPRELVLLPCGHVCVCADCCQALPAPATCPVCRAEVERVVATYVS